MNILNISKYYIDNLDKKEYKDIIKNTITRNRVSILNQIQIVLHNQAERERAINEIKEAMKNDSEADKKMNTKRFSIDEINPLKNQKQIIKFQTEDLMSRGVLKIRTNIDENNLNSDIITKFYPEEQNLIITLILENIVDTQNHESYAYTIEYVLLKFENDIIGKLISLDEHKINIILLSSLRTLISYTIAAGIFLTQLEHTTNNYIKYIEENEEYKTIKEALIFMNNNQ